MQDTLTPEDLSRFDRHKEKGLQLEKPTPILREYKIGSFLPSWFFPTFRMERILRDMVSLRKGTCVTPVDIKLQRGFIWYQVRVDGVKPLGWINTKALLGMKEWA